METQKYTREIPTLRLKSLWPLSSEWYKTTLNVVCQQWRMDQNVKVQQIIFVSKIVLIPFLLLLYVKMQSKSNYAGIFLVFFWRNTLQTGNDLIDLKIA